MFILCLRVLLSCYWEYIELLRTCLHSLFGFRYHSPIHRVLSPGSETTPTTSNTENTHQNSPYNTHKLSAAPQVTTSNENIKQEEQPSPPLTERYSMVFFYYPNYFSQITRNDQYTFNAVCGGEFCLGLLLCLCCVFVIWYRCLLYMLVVHWVWLSGIWFNELYYDWYINLSW